MTTLTQPLQTPVHSGNRFLTQVNAALLIALPMLLFISKAYADIAVILICLSYLVHATLTRVFLSANKAWFIAIAVFWAWLMAISLHALDPHDAFVQAAVFIRFPIFALAVANWLAPTPTFKRFFLPTLLVWFGIACLDVWVQYLTGHDLIGQPIRADGRLISFSTKPNIGYKMQEFGLLAIGFLITRPQFKHSKWLWVIPILGTTIITLSIFITGERAATLLIFIGLLISFVCIKPLRKPLLITGLLIVFGGGIIASQNSYLKGRLYSVSGFSEDMVTHVHHIIDKPFKRDNTQPSSYRELYTYAFHIMRHHPWTGIGVKQYPHACMHYFKPPTWCPSHPHNMYIEILLVSGIIGLSLFLIAVFFIFRGVTQNWSCFQQHPLAQMVIIALVMRLWPLVPSTSFFFSWFAIPLWLYVGWLYHQINTNQ